MQTSTPAAFKLMLDGSQAFSDIEQNGMRIDVKYLDNIIVQTGKKIKQMEYDLRHDEVFNIWRKLYGVKADLGSRKQLGRVIFDEMGIECKHFTKAGNPKTDASAFEEIDVPFVTKWNNFESLKKLRSTNLIGVRREVVDGYLHAFFNLHLAITFRSSSSQPNFQNQPNRDPKQAKLIRRAFIPRKNHVLIEADYSAIEVRIAACYHEDPTMIQYIKDDYDLHLDMAAECYKLPKKQVSKEIRFMGKSGFVFPSFYGDWYHSICQSMWKAVDSDKLTLKNGTSLRDHLTSKGLTELGNLDPRNGVKPNSFEAHIKKVEDKFWSKRFPVYTQWKKDWWESYLEQGYFMMKTGFVSKGIFRKNEVINSPVQGAAFHCLLWATIEMNKWLKDNKMKSVVVGQIHDSLVLDVAKDELKEVLPKLKQVMTVDLREAWKWITVPLAVEAEMTETNWYEKKEIEL